MKCLFVFYWLTLASCLIFLNYKTVDLIFGSHVLSPLRLSCNHCDSHGSNYTGLFAKLRNSVVIAANNNLVQ